MKKKRRTREPFIVTSEWKGNRQQETRWHFSIKDIKKDIEKYLKNQNWFFTNPKSSHMGDLDYNPNNYKLISILPYPNAYSIYVDMGQYEKCYNINAHTITDARKIARKENPGKKVEVKQTLQII